ncbi:hypothetical protein GCM10009111_23330 [Colwellia asteriadis]|uniref:Uncharacterized protein n=1 Tax=Colwellia asteriadis TaxID=517723 RepID=A0ABN1L8D4_9GAMM
MKISGYGDSLSLTPENKDELKALNDFFIEMQEANVGNGSAKSTKGRVQIIKSETYNNTEFSIDLD